MGGTQAGTEGIPESGTAGTPAGLVIDALRDASMIPGTLAVQILGAHSGTVYLKHGRVTGADSSGTPDIRTRLIRAGLVDDHAGRTGTGSPAALGEDLRQRIADGAVDVSDVESVALSVILDATQSLLYPPGDTPAQVSLRPGEESAHGIDHRIPVESLIVAVSERAAHCRALAVDADRPVTLQRLGQRPGVVIEAAQWHIVSRVDGRLTPRDLARAAGAELYATLLELDRLVAAGLCASQRPQDAPRPGSGRSLGVMPQRQPGTPSAGVIFSSLTGPPEWADDLTQEVAIEPELIQRLISGLRALG